MTVLPDGNIIVMVGTARGGFIFTSGPDRSDWTMSGPTHRGSQVYHLTLDPRDGQMFAAVNNIFFGPEINRSSDLGETWTESSEEPRFKQDSGEKLEAMWHIAPGRPEEQGVLYVGAAPASLWKTTDSGETWTELRSLAEHPSRPDWEPGAGGLCLHTILLDPERPGRMYAGISAVGLFRTDDGGETWQLNSQGLVPALPPRVDENSGRCVHKAVLDPTNSEIVFQQSHRGTYRSRDGGLSWDDIGDDLPSSFGFPMVNHPRRPGTLYTVMMDSDEFRSAAEGRVAVWITDDAGESWQASTRGLPQRDAYTGVLREAMSVDGADPLGIYLGTTGGALYRSPDEGESWELMADNLPRILSVEARVLG